MQTCKDWVFKELYKNNSLTKSARILFLFLLAHCDESGTIAIYHKDIEKIIGIDTKTFYTALAQLEQTKVTYIMPNQQKATTSLIVREKKECKQEIIIKIPNNSFVKPYKGEKKRYCNYIDLDYDILLSANLRTMCHAGLRIMLYLFFRASKSGNPTNYTIFKSKRTAFVAIAKQLNLKAETVRKAIAALIKNNHTISFEHTNDILENPCITQKNVQRDSVAYDVTASAIYTKVSSATDDNENGITHEKHFRADRHTVRNIIRRSKRFAPESGKDIDDISALMNQYRKKAQSKGLKIETVFAEVIAKCAILKARLVHKEIREFLAL